MKFYTFARSSSCTAPPMQLMDLYTHIYIYTYSMYMQCIESLVIAGQGSKQRLQINGLPNGLQPHASWLPAKGALYLGMGDGSPFR